MVSIGIRRCDEDYYCVLLDCLFGERLRKLKIHSMKIDPIFDLLPCSNLEQLFLEECSFTPVADEEAFVELVPTGILVDLANSFLPKLKTLSTKYTCFGQWSRLFECHRPSLTKLTVSCFHFGLPYASRFNWEDSPNLWPSLKELGIRNNDASLMSLLHSIAPLLTNFIHLKTLVVPRYWYGHRSVSLSFDTLDEMKNLNLPVALSVTTMDHGCDMACFRTD